MWPFRKKVVKEPVDIWKDILIEYPIIVDDVFSEDDLDPFINCDRFVEWQEAIIWIWSCGEPRPRRGAVNVNNTRFYFKNANDAVEFKLRFSK